MRQTVYLAGGMRSDWQMNVKRSVHAANRDVQFFDPMAREQDLTFSEYSVWDLHKVKQSDIVFAYMEQDNISGYGMSVEIGYAKGLGKTVILCRESNRDSSKDRYLRFMDSCADIVFNDIDKAVNYLNILLDYKESK